MRPILMVMIITAILYLGDRIVDWYYKTKAAIRLRKLLTAANDMAQKTATAEYNGKMYSFKHIAGKYYSCDTEEGIFKEDDGYLIPLPDSKFKTNWSYS